MKLVISHKNKMAKNLVLSKATEWVATHSVQRGIVFRRCRNASERVQRSRMRVSVELKTFFSQSHGSKFKDL